MAALAADPGREGPLARAISREASRLAGESSPPAASQGWDELRRFEPGKRIVVMTSSTTIAGAFVAADDVRLRVRSGDAIQIIDAQDVLLVTSNVRRGLARAAVFGTLGGIWLGSALAVGLAEGARCYDGCAGVRLGVWSVIIGIPAAGGYGAWYQSSRLREEVVYRKP